MVRNHHLAKSISDAGWSQWRRGRAGANTDWLDYYGSLWSKVVVAADPRFTSQDCSHCGHLSPKSLSTRTHQCPRCGLEMCRDENAAHNILKRGLELVGKEWNRTVGHTGTGLAITATSGDINTSELMGQPVDLSVVGDPEKADRKAV